MFSKNSYRRSFIIRFMDFGKTDKSEFGRKLINSLRFLSFLGIGIIFVILQLSSILQSQKDLLRALSSICNYAADNFLSISQVTLSLPPADGLLFFFKTLQKLFILNGFPSVLSLPVEAVEYYLAFNLLNAIKNLNLNLFVLALSS